MSSTSLAVDPSAKADSNADVIAAVDLGSNSFHLIIARISNGTLQPLVKDKQMVRLADGLDSRRHLSDIAMERGLNVLKSFGLAIQNIQPGNVRCVGTFTLRRAKNRNQFLRRARELFDFPIEIISGDEEARLIYQGVAHTTPHEGRRLVIDIGGGSTEFAIGEHFELQQLSSLPMGSLSYTKRFFGDKKIVRGQFRQAELFARQRLEVISPRFINTGWNMAIGCSGTVRALTAYAQTHQLITDDNLTLDVLKAIRKNFIAAGTPQKIEGVEEARQPIVAAGLAILIAIFKEFKIDKLAVSEAALREGVLYELTERMEHHDIRERTVNSLVVRYDIDLEQAHRVTKQIDNLFNALRDQFPKRQADDLHMLLRWAGLLHEIGLHINRRGIQRHSAYILENTELPGFSSDEQQVLSLLTGNYRKRFNRSAFPEFSKYNSDSLMMMVVILRLATLLNIRRLDSFLPDIEVSGSADSISLKFPKSWLKDHSVVDADLQSEAAYLSDNGFKLEFS